jgi:hypothetical protein
VGRTLTVSVAGVVLVLAVTLSQLPPRDVVLVTEKGIGPAVLLTVMPWAGGTAEPGVNWNVKLDGVRIGAAELVTLRFAVTVAVAPELLKVIVPV